MTARAVVHNEPESTRQAAALPCAVALRDALNDVSRPLWFIAGSAGPELASAEPLRHRVAAYVPPVAPEALGDAGFRGDYGLRFNYVAGAMANGIASVELVTAMARGGMLGFFGAAGLSAARVDESIRRIQQSIGGRTFGCNLIHSPNEPRLEADVAEVFIRRGVRLVEASAYLDLTLPLVAYRLHGICRDGEGRLRTPNRIVAKASRVEVAGKFFAPPPDRLVRELVQQGRLTVDQAELAKKVPVAQDLTAEADSGGHTDNRPLVALVPTFAALRDRMQAQHGYNEPLRFGAAGGISTPAATAAAFAMGAAYVLTGTVNQACVESGSSAVVREMLAEAGQADVAMAPAADMFEMGVKLQVLKRGTLFAMRAAKLYELYRAYPSLEAIPANEMAKLERDQFRCPVDEVWRQTRLFWSERDPDQLQRAEAEPKHKMALVFRWYLGLSSRWANTGEPTRKMDYQIWCGPAMGAFNEWARGSFLEKPENRRVAAVAWQLLHGAAVQIRISMLRAQGVAVPPDAARIVPRAELSSDS